jgi:hypothetical protein
MSNKFALSKLLVTCLCFLFIGGVSKAHACAGGGAVSLSIDTVTVNVCVGPETGPPIQNGTRLLAGVGTQGVQCPGCSAEVQCYAAQDITLQYHSVMIFNINTTVDLHGTTFYWTPAYGPGTYYFGCEITYHNNPYAPTNPEWTQDASVTVE